MEKLETPQSIDISHYQSLKITLLNAKKSSNLGIAFIVIPGLFLLGILIKYLAGFDMKPFTAIEDNMALLDKSHYFKWLTPLLLVGLPLISVIINSLAIAHFDWNKTQKELIISIRFRVLNIILIVVSAGIVAIFLLYAIAENLHHFSTMP